MMTECRGCSRGGVHRLRAPTGLCSTTALRSLLRRRLVAMIVPVFPLVVALVAPVAAAVECRIWWGTLPGQDPLDRFPTYLSGTRVAAFSPYPLLSDRDEITPPEEWVLPGDVQTVRSGAVGTGYPPFNNGRPPVNLAFIDACLTGLTNEFAWALLVPYYSAYNQNWCENQCEVGWRLLTALDATSATGSAFWEALAGGATAHEARDKASDAYYDSIQEPRQDPRATLSVWGDYYTWLYGLYTYGDSIASGFWHD